MKKTLVLWTSLSMFASLLASCGPLSDSPSTASPTTESPKIQPPSQTANSGNIEKPIAIPPSYGERPGQSPQNQTAYMPNGMPVLQPPMGANTTLFNEDISDTSRRFERVENAVSDLRREFDAIKPAIVRLVAVESDIQDLIKQLDMMLQSPSPAPVTEAPMPTPLAPPQQVIQDTPDIEPAPSVNTTITETTAPPPKPPVAQSGGPTVQDLRVGTHADKVRLVLDVNKQTPYSIDLDNQENLMIIDLPEAAWSGPAQKTFSSPLLAGYTVEGMNDGKGSRVIITLKKPSRILKEQALPPGSNPLFRVFVDLAK